MARFRSLSSRFVLASLLLLPLFLGVSGYMLDRSFQQSQRAAKQEQLKSYIYLLMGAAELENGELWMPEQLTEPRFNTLNSGLMAAISDRNGVMWQSASAALAQNLPIDATPISIGDEHFFKANIDGQAPPASQWFVYSHDVSWQQESGDKLLRFSVLQDQSPLLAQLTSYRRQLWQWLGALGLLLVLLQLLIMRWGLKPLRDIADDLQQIEQGAKQQLGGDYPREITPVTDNLNRVLNSERQQRERYRNTMGDLAHSLKTPLAVMRGQLNSSEKSGVIDQQLSRMDDIVRHQLQRAVRSDSTVDGRHPVKPVVERITRTLAKIHSNGAINFDLRIAPHTEFRGDEADLLEVLGNLLENACKYGAGQVLVAAENHGDNLVLSVEDNGPGVTSEQQSVILQRGARADTTQPGHGIGLAVVIDIVSSYNGELRIEQSELGGAKFRVSL